MFFSKIYSEFSLINQFYQCFSFTINLQSFTTTFYKNNSQFLSILLFSKIYLNFFTFKYRHNVEQKKKTLESSSTLYTVRLISFQNSRLTRLKKLDSYIFLIKDQIRYQRPVKHNKIKQIVSREMVQPSKSQYSPSTMN